jgi:hypothetical protein
MNEFINKLQDSINDYRLQYNLGLITDRDLIKRIYEVNLIILDDAFQTLPDHD